ncbi:hypothetical protein NB699_001762 [Xanthomonas sacchari]|nr:hypothetical protein [Xanthomonas sacchari]MCW0441310.1 hypothetical protein [Xanthomonas sacchari]
MAGSNCSDPALKLQTYLGNVPLGYAAQDALLRAALTGAGTQVGSVTRTGETIAGVVAGIWSLTPYERFKSSYDDLGYLQENGIGAYMDRNLDQGAKLLHAVKDYASSFGSAVATGALGSWDIYDLYEQGKTQGKIGVDILSLLVPAGAVGEAGTVAAKAGTAFTADELIAAYRQLKPVVSEGTANAATAGELANYLRQLEHADSSANEIASGAKATDTVDETAGSIRGVNPGYPEAGRTHNCVNCAIATDATLAGNPASALPINSTDGVSITVLEKQFGTKFVSVPSAESIYQKMNDIGAGARGIVYGSYGPGQPGHVFNVVNQNGVIRFLDGQTGKAAELDKFKSFKFLRTN